MLASVVKLKQEVSENGEVKKKSLKISKLSLLFTTVANIV